MADAKAQDPPSLIDRLAIPPSALLIPAPSTLSSGSGFSGIIGSSSSEAASYRARLASFPPPKYSERDVRDGGKDREKEKESVSTGMMGMNLTNLAPSALSANLSNSVSDLFLSSLLPSSLPRASSSNSSAGLSASTINGIRFHSLTSQKEPLSLPLMTNNFRRFVARCGFAFWSMDRVEEVMYWRKKERTLVYIVVWGIISFHPRLLLLIPSAILLLLLLSSYVSSHPSLSTSAVSITMNGTTGSGMISTTSATTAPSAPSSSTQSAPSDPIPTSTSSTSLLPQSLNPGSIKAGLLASQLARDVMGKVTMNYDANHLGLGLGSNIVGSSPRKTSTTNVNAGKLSSSPTDGQPPHVFGEVISATAAEMKKQDDLALSLDRQRSRSREENSRERMSGGGASHSMENETIGDGSGKEMATAPAGTAESGVDYYLNLQGIQNLMGMVSDVHDAVVPYATLLSPPTNNRSGPAPPITFPLSTTHILLLLLPPTIILPLLPPSAMPFVLLTLGWAPLIVFHPSFTMENLQPLISFANQLAMETSDWYHGTDTTESLSTSVAPYGLKRLYSKAERWALTDRLEDVIARSEIREVFVWENERLDGSWVANNVKPLELRAGSTVYGLSSEDESAGPGESLWSEKHLKSSERQGWVKALPMRRPEESLWEDNPVISLDGADGNGDGNGRGRDSARDGGQRVALSLVKGWGFVPGEDWRVDVVGDWNGLRADEKGWVYFNDSWEEPSTQAVVIKLMGDRQWKEVKVTRRRRWWRRVYSESEAT